jgi:peptide methionine sulfoxide reductase msrA/msrB
VKKISSIILFTVLSVICSNSLGETETMQKATFAGGCFWCMVKPFDQFDGVISVTSGYTGGTVPNPAYKTVCGGKTGHVEAVQIIFDPKKISYEQLLTLFWRQIDPTDDGGQFNDRGLSYRTAIFYHNEEQKRFAEASRDALEKEKRFSKPVVTKILPVAEFYKAETEHQNFYKTNPEHYERYVKNSGRLHFQTKNWDKNHLDRKELQKRLTKIQFDVTQNSATEPAFRNEYWNNHAEGIYVDIVDGTPLFTSKDKFDSNCGWASFSKPITDTKIVEKSDFSHGMKRIEVRSFSANSHLGHVFNDGLKTLGGLRYCINSAAVRFVPKEKMQEEGYGDLLPLLK